MAAEQETMASRQSSAGPSGTLSPLRKAMSLSTLFRHNLDAKQSSASQSQANNKYTAQSTQSSASPPVSSTLLPSSTSSTLPHMKRMRRRLSFRKSPSMSPNNAIGAGSYISSPQNCTDTPSSIASSASGATPASLSSSSGSTFAATFSNPRGRPRSGSCRASLLSGGGRILPFTIPGSTTEEELSVDETPKGNRASKRNSRVRSTSSSPPMPPRRPVTPAPLLVLDEDMNSLGITTRPLSPWLASPSARTPTDTLSRQNGLGLSAPFASSYPDASMAQLHLPSSSMHRLSLCPSQESFHCRGLEQGNGKTIEPSAMILPSNAMAPPMIRSVSATTTTSEGSKARLNKDINPGSPLGWRRRPWALSLQLQPHGHTSRPLASPTGLTPPPTAKPAKIEEDKCQSDVVSPPSRFSLSSEDTSNVSRLSSNQQTDEETEVHEDEMSSFVASPGSEWSSSAFSFDTTLESPTSRPESQFGPSPDPSNVSATIRRRSNTVSVIPDPRSSSLPSRPLKYVRKAIPVMHITTAATVNDDIPAICPASPPARVRLHLSLPPSTVAKGLPQAHTMLMPTTASTLEFKETICRSLQLRHGLSISPSQLGLFVPEQQNESNLSLSPNQSPLHLGSNGSTSPFSRSPCLPSSSTLGSSKGGFLRSRLRSSSNAGARVSMEGIPSSSSVQQQQQQQTSNQLLSPSLRSSQALRQMQNESALYQEGLQDDDLIIVRF
ncbi:uncharacterized protein FA14DRAFT_179234 [Meira miltonrushii]|uniref:Uncharacterized protein n=1 Tax=Meira miltonrushii TaxID=1280837 RepID=A0A316VDV9_9BASI|nr:uncharacterized protein FA14DRAFT_179234 [Meira miltonrushii]PWN35867.1 hypothetical protein FA14DRAFT_179234 [Meira miltonrushii]